ncbi:MAG: hypothetical protein ABSE27_11525 [Acidobacteriaceae bacterium]|jgi:hypothetical protein
MMARKSQYTSLSILFGFMLMMCGLLHPAVGQAAPAQGQVAPAQPQQPSKGSSQFKPVSLEHLYWHFLVLQNYLDTKSVELESNGKDGRGLRNNLQKQLGWSDADYALIRTSSVRLTAELKDLDAQAAAIRTADMSSSSHEQLKALTVQRETSINSEITFLKQNLPPDKIRAFEIFLIQLFAPKSVSPRPPSPAKPAVTGQPAPAAVQK